MPLDHPEDARAWADHHGDWAATAGAVVTAIRDTFETLAHIQFDAPWQDAARRRTTRR